MFVLIFLKNIYKFVVLKGLLGILRWATWPRFPRSMMEMDDVLQCCILGFWDPDADSIQSQSL